MARVMYFMVLLLAVTIADVLAGRIKKNAQTITTDTSAAADKAAANATAAEAIPFVGQTVTLKAACSGRYLKVTGDTASTNSYAGSCEKFTLTKDTRTTDEYNLKGMCNNRPYLSVGHDNKVGTYGSAGHCQHFKLQKSGNEYGLRAACGGKHYVKVEHTGEAMTYPRLGHCEGFTIVSHTAAQAKTYCANACKQKGYCCNDKDRGSNQFVSCSQACYAKMVQGNSMPNCQAKCPGTGTVKRACRATFGTEKFSMCSSCNDKTSKCPHGVQSADECKDGCDIGAKAIAKKASSLVEESEEGADEDVEHDVAALQEEAAVQEAIPFVGQTVTLKAACS